MKYCSQCKAGEIKKPADYFVKGIIQGDYKMIPYRAYICSDHLQMLEDDEAQLKIIEYISHEAILKRADFLTRENTAYNSFSELCRNNPTLRGFSGSIWLSKQYNLRK